MGRREYGERICGDLFAGNRCDERAPEKAKQNPRQETGRPLVGGFCVAVDGTICISVGGLRLSNAVDIVQRILLGGLVALFGAFFQK